MIQIIKGKIPSKSNSYKIVTIKGHASLAKQSSLRAYENQRPDLDNSMKILLDCLQECKAIVNDRNCVKITAEKFIDKDNPRIEFELVEV